MQQMPSLWWQRLCLPASPDSIRTHLTCLLSKLSKVQQNFGCLTQLHVQMEVMSDVGKMYLQISHRHIFNLSTFAHLNCGHSQSAIGDHHTWPAHPGNINNKQAKYQEQPTKTATNEGGSIIN